VQKSCRANEVGAVTVSTPVVVHGTGIANNETDAADFVQLAADQGSPYERYNYVWGWYSTLGEWKLQIGPSRERALGFVAVN
jgi:hypothetical protein